MLTGGYKHRTSHMKPCIENIWKQTARWLKHVQGSLTAARRLDSPGDAWRAILAITDRHKRLLSPLVLSAMMLLLLSAWPTFQVAEYEVNVDFSRFKNGERKLVLSVLSYFRWRERWRCFTQWSACNFNAWSFCRLAGKLLRVYLRSDAPNKLLIFWDFVVLVSSFTNYVDRYVYRPQLEFVFMYSCTVNEVNVCLILSLRLKDKNVFV